MSKESELKSQITISQGSLPPAEAVLGISPFLADHSLPKSGAEGLELLPFWGISLEILTMGKLLNPNVVTSLHQTWKTDTMLEKQARVPTRGKDHFIRTLCFPPKPLTDRVMRKLWKKYPDLHTVVHSIGKENTLGMDDSVRFYLELAHQNRVQLENLIIWVGEKPQTRGIVFPSRDDQFEGWRQKYAPGNHLSWRGMAEALIPQIRSIHLGPIPMTEIEAAYKGDRKSTSTEERLRTLYKLGFTGSAVIEINCLALQSLAGGRYFDYLKAVVGRFKDTRDQSSG